MGDMGIGVWVGKKKMFGMATAILNPHPYTILSKHHPTITSNITVTLHVLIFSARRPGKMPEKVNVIFRTY